MFWSTLRINIIFIVCLLWASLTCAQLDELQLKDLRGDSLLSLSEVQAPVIVLVFDQLNCPYVTEYESRLDSLMAYFGKRGVQFIYVNSDTRDNQRGSFLIDAKKRYSKLPQNTPYICDPYAKYMYTLNIQKAPEVAVMKKKSGAYVTRYVGGIDDSPLEEGDARTSFLKRAIEQVLNSEKVSTKQQRTAGCMIKRF